MKESRKIRGSLLERAAERYDLANIAAPRVSGEEPKPAWPEPEQVAQAAVEPEQAPPVRLKRGYEEADAPAAMRSVLIPQGRTAVIDRDRINEYGMLIPGAPVDALAEEFRLVKRQLLLTSRAIAAQDEGRSRMILICSARPGEGKTFCAINLALSMAAEKDVEILLVDADFAKPDVLDRLGIEPGPGLLDALAGETIDVEDCIVRTDVPRLSILSAGTKSASDTEWLASARARTILEGLAGSDPRRIVIFDSPPALAASPASVLALLVGQAMMVVRADRTSERDLREAVGILDGCEQIQLILNSVSYQPGGRRFGSYYGQETSK